MTDILVQLVLLSSSAVLLGLGYYVSQMLRMLVIRERMEIKKKKEER